MISINRHEAHSGFTRVLTPPIEKSLYIVFHVKNTILFTAISTIVDGRQYVPLKRTDGNT